MTSQAKSVQLSSDLWRNRNYPTRVIPHLPQHIHCTDHVTLLLDYGCNADIQICRDLVSAAAQLGDNVGLDEFSAEEDLKALLGPSEMFVLKNPTTTNIQAVILISLPYFLRTFDPCVAQIFVFRSRDLSTNDDVYGSLVGVAERLAMQLDVGYTQCMVCVADSCNATMKQLRRRNFFAVATIPNSVEMVKVGLRDNVVMVKHLGLPDREPRSETDVESLIESIFHHLALDGDPPKKLEFPRVPFLPQEFAIGPETMVTFRNIEVCEFRLLFRMFEDMVKKGQGYARHEVPTYDCFLNFVLAGSFCVFIEDQLTKHIISWAIIGDSIYSRRRQTRTFADCSLGIANEFQNLGFGKTIVEAVHGLCVELGYEIMFNDFIASNYKMALISQKIGSLVLGVIPKGCYVVGCGWDDQVIICVFLRQKVKRFLIFAEESLRMHQKAQIPKLSSI